MTKIDGITDLETDVSSQTAKFKAKKDLDVDSILSDLAKTNEHIEGWSKN